MFIFTPCRLSDTNSLWITDSHVVSSLFRRRSLYSTGVLLAHTQEYLSPLFSSSSTQDIKPNTHPSCLSTRSLVAWLWKYLRPQFTLMREHIGFLYWYTDCPGERFTGVLCSGGQMATVSQDQGLLSHVPSWLAAVVFTPSQPGQFLTTAARNCLLAMRAAAAAAGCYCLFSPRGGI